MELSFSPSSDAAFRRVVEASPVGMLLVDKQGTIVFLNSQVEKMFGYARDELFGQSVQLLVPTAARHAHTDSLAGFMTEDRPRAMGAGRDLSGLRKDGTEIPVEIGLNPIHTESSIFILASIVDISERRRANELEKARDKAIQESQMKSAFVAKISHELRTPLSGIIGMNELLMASTLDFEQSTLVKAIGDVSQYLLNIVNELLDISTIEAGRTALRNEHFCIITLVEDAVKMLIDKARAKGLTVTTLFDHSIPSNLLGDGERITQVFVNLLSNAINYTNKGSVNIEVSIEELQGNKVQLKIFVRDTGIGISSENIQHLFRPFSRLDNVANRSVGGSGLGLSISKTLVELMGGQIFVESTLGKGSTFSFSLPLKKVDHTIRIKAGHESRLHNTLTPLDASLIADKSVLVVEDNCMLRDLAARQFSLIGLQAQSVSNGIQAVEAIQERSYDLILMDCQLPGLNGYEATKKIRELDLQRGQHTPIVAMTAASMPEEIAQCIEAGMDDYLLKPVTVAKLKEHARKWLVSHPLKQQ